MRQTLPIGVLCCALWLALASRSFDSTASPSAARAGPAAESVRSHSGMLEARAGLFSRLAHGNSRASTGATWREARLQNPGELHDRRISAFARRYGIGSGLSRQIYEAACAEQVHPALAFGLVKTESGFDAGAVGPTGSIGLTQLQPDTARELSPSVSVGDLYRPRVNLALGFRYLRRQLDRFDDVTLALAAYNGGPSRVETLLASGRHPRGAYARKVLRNVEPASRAAL